MERPLSSTAGPFPSVPSDAAGRIRTSVAKWGVGLGTLAGAVTGALIGLLFVNLDASLIAVGLIVGALLGFIFGGAIAIVDSFALGRFLPAVNSGKTNPLVASAGAAAISVVVVFGLALFLLNLVWHDVYREPFIVAPVFVVAFLAWIACTFAGERALISALHLPIKPPATGAPIAPGSHS
jgi:hypothetical protein